MPETILRRNIITPQWLRPFRPLRKAMLPLLPSIIESFDFSEYDLLISTSSCVAKGAIPRPGAKHICYLHSPMRYVWDQRHEYLGRLEKIPILNIFIALLVK